MLKLPKSPIWLRDHCRCVECFHPITKQRLVDVFTKDLKILDAKQSGDNLEIKWMDGHVSQYNKQLLTETKPKKLDYKYWDSKFVPKPTDYEDIMFGDGLTEWVKNIHEYGLGFVSNVPKTAEATKELAEKLTFIRHSHYGGFWESTADLSIIH